MSSFKAVLPWLLYFFATCLPIIAAQTIFSTNGNSTVPRERKFVLVTTIEGGKQSLVLDPLTDEAGVAGDLQQLRVCNLSIPML